MPFLGKKLGNDVDYKARLERKLCIAREDPEPIFDLSDCSLKTVPNGIYSLCKVFRKEALYLQNNQLCQLSGGGSLSDLFLIQVLNLHSNQFTKIPQEIKFLKNLTVFIVSNNMIQTLPDTIGNLTCLVTLDMSNNKLKELTPNLGRCRKLQCLNIENNPKLKALPKTLGYLNNLKQFKFDATLNYPPSDVLNSGLENILEFLLGECDEKWVADDGDPLLSETNDNNLDNINKLQERLQQLEQFKMVKQQERLEVERLLAEEQDKEIELQEANKQNKYKLVEDLKSQQIELDNEIMKIQGKRDEERQLLIQQINNAENLANSTVEHLLEASRKLREKAVKTCEHDFKMEEEMFSNLKKTNVEKSKVLDAMNILFEEELSKAEKLKEYEAFREQTAREFVQKESMLSLELVEKLKDARREQTVMLEKLHQDEELQRAAVATLMERSDERSWELNQQVALVQAKLAELTQLELTKRKLETSDQINELGNSRIALTTLLIDLFSQQTERRGQLLDRLRRMERARDDGDDFWLQQYQLLLESKLTEATDRNVDPRLANSLILYNVFHYLPLLAPWIHSHEMMSTLTHEQLVQVGVCSEEDRVCILKSVSEYLNDAAPAPSAPFEYQASAPMLPTTSNLEQVKHFTEDCVVCLDNQCNVIFVPCGHLCCCVECCFNVTSCPLCRTNIQDKIQYIL